MSPDEIAASIERARRIVEGHKAIVFSAQGESALADALLLVHGRLEEADRQLRLANESAAMWKANTEDYARQGVAVTAERDAAADYFETAQSELAGERERRAIVEAERDGLRAAPGAAVSDASDGSSVPKDTANRDPRREQIEGAISRALTPNTGEGALVIDSWDECRRVASYLADAVLAVDQPTNAERDGSSVLKGMANREPPAEFARARSLLGQQVVVTLAHDDPEAIAEGRLLSLADSGEVAVEDEMGFVHYCWPMLSVRRVPAPTEGAAREQIARALHDIKCRCGEYHRKRHMAEHYRAADVILALDQPTDAKRDGSSIPVGMANREPPAEYEWAEVVECWENEDTRTHADIYYAVENVMRCVPAPTGAAVAPARERAVAPPPEPAPVCVCVTDAEAMDCGRDCQMRLHAPSVEETPQPERASEGSSE